MGISSASTEVAKSTANSIDRDNKSTSIDPSISEEKGEVIDVDTSEHANFLLSHEEQFPEDPDGELETQQFTFRAVLVGSILGGVIAASKYVSSQTLCHKN